MFQLGLHRVAATLGVVLAAATACGTTSTPGGPNLPGPSGSPALSAADHAYVDLIRGYWADLHVADITAAGQDVDAKACLGELGPTSPQDVKVVEPQVCRAYAVATMTASQKFLATLGAIQAPGAFSADDQVFRTHIPIAISDLKALITACDGQSRRAIIDAMWAFAREMIPDVTNALDDVEPSVKHLDPSGTQTN